MQKVKVLNEQGIASQFGPESCGGGGNPVVEALTGERAGRVWSRENHAPLRKQRVLRGADVVEEGGRRNRASRTCKARRDPARSETPGMHGSTAYGNREIPRSSAGKGPADRIGQSKDERR